MKHLNEEIDLTGRLETISMTELRSQPGEVFKATQLGKVFLIKSNEKVIAVISRPPGVNLAMEIDCNGNISYGL